jgi:hypothetical protein
MRTVTEPEVRFARAIKKTRKCWLWTKSKNHSGYGQFNAGSGRTILAHRYSYEIHHGPIPKNFFICHKCDQPSCVNPKHLFAGTNADNIADMKKKGRSLKGERHPHSRFKDSDILNIRKSAETIQALSEKYKTSTGSISRIRNGKRWGHLPKARSGTLFPRLRKGDVLKIKSLLRGKTPQSKIAEMFRVSQASVSNINTGLRWRV